jgi:Holliday junction resolvasome RuvABC endonuclease subunit
MKSILAIDPGINCGWAVLANGRIESGVTIFELGRGDSPGMRFVRFNSWLANTLTMTAPGLVIYERPLLKFGYSAEVMAGFITRIQEACASRGINHETVHSATLKKAACGSGRASQSRSWRGLGGAGGPNGCR